MRSRTNRNRMIEYSKNIGRITARVSDYKREGNGSIATALQSSAESKEIALERLYVISLLNLEQARLIVESVKRELKETE